MCGIFASVSSEKNCFYLMDKVLSGLKSLEYRGYDSAGIGWVHERNVHIRKSVGDVDTLRQALPAVTPYATVALSHTRWATHGKPSLDNAHPMQGERFVIVHNGILDHYKVYRDVCRQDGYSFRSQTDTEVLLMMMERAASFEADSLEMWMPSLLSSFAGQWAIVWVDKTAPDFLYAFSHGRPLVLSHDNKEYGWISSDIMSLVPFTDVYTMALEDTLIRVSSEGAWAYVDNIWQPLIYDAHNLTIEEQYKGDFEHYMLKEIYEQPANIFKQYTIYQESSAYIDPWIDALKSSQDIMIIACGSSYYAACVARYAMEKYLKKRVSVDIASEFNERSPALLHDTVVIVISQSGETADTLIALEYAQSHGLKVAALCNVMSSAIAMAADYVLPLLAGVEIGVASTKAFCAQVFALLYLTRRLSKESVDIEDVEKLVQLLTQQLALKEQIQKTAQSLIQYDHVMFIARDHIVPIAFEAALKYKEITYIHAEAYAAGELKHGPLALIDKNHPTVALIEPAHRDKLMSNIEEIKARDGHVIIFEMTDEHLHADVSWAHSIPQWLHPLAFLIPVQLLAYYSCVHLGHNVDRPRNLAKCVTVE